MGCNLEFQRFEWNLLGRKKEFTGESIFSRPAIEGFLSGYSRSMRIVVFLGQVCKNEVASSSVEAGSGVSVCQKFADRVIGKMTVLT